MPNKSEKKAQEERRPKELGSRWLVPIVFLFACYLLYVAVHLVQQPTLPNLFLLCFFAYILWRLGYELLLNRHHVPVWASSFWERRKIAQLLQNHFMVLADPSPVVVDLGSGCGELTRCMARALPKAQIIGIEKSRNAYRQSVFFQRLFGLKNLSYENISFFPYDCSAADAVVMYLGDELTQQAGEKLWKELKPGAIVIANESPLLGAWPAPEVITFHAPFKAVLFVYKR